MKEDKEERTGTHSFCTQVGLPFHNHKIWTSVVYHLSTYEWMGMKEKKVLFACRASCFDLPHELDKIWQNIYDKYVKYSYPNNQLLITFSRALIFFEDRLNEIQELIYKVF